jgi:dephospho-CoA kinase
MKVAVTGRMRTGKDTVADFFIKKDRSQSLYFGEGIKQVIQTYFPDKLKEGKPRKIYQSVGQHFRTIDPDVWIKFLDKRYRKLLKYGAENFVVTDLRQPNEYSYLKDNGFIVIKVEADDELRKERIMKSGDVFDEEDFYHETELAVDSLPCDYVVTNNDTLEALIQQLEFIYEESKGERIT